MSKYPVPIFQPTIPHDCQTNPLLLEQIHSWMNLQMERHEAFRRQLETQNHLLMQLNRRLDHVFLKLATFETDPAVQASQYAGLAASHGPQSPDSPDMTGRGEHEGNPFIEAEDESARVGVKPAIGPENGPRIGVSSWMQQRESMLKCLVAQLEIEDSLYPAEMEPLAPPPSEELAIPSGVAGLDQPTELPREELREIDALKEQLQAAIREMEVECSVQRAKLSHERARLEAREAELQRREKKLVRENREQLIAEERAEPLVSRIKGLLRRS